LEGNVPLIVSPSRRTHILDGDERGGGHGARRSIPGKSEFPAYISDDEVIRGIEAIANNRTYYPRGRMPAHGKHILRGGRIKGVAIVVIVDLDGEGILTAWPEGVARNP
jgi:hypothetical protein